MITGIGTPNSQSRIPRPILASLKSSDGFKNATRDLGFQRPGENFLRGDRSQEGSAEGRFAWPFAGFHQLGIAAVFSRHLQKPLAHF